MLDFSFSGRTSLFVDLYYRNVVSQVSTMLQKIEDDQVLENDDGALTEYFIAKFAVEPLQIDPNRETTSVPSREFRTGRDPWFDRFVEHEIEYAVVRVPLIPKVSNETVVGLTGQNWPGVMVEVEGEFDGPSHQIVIRVPSAQVGSVLAVLKQRILQIDGDITRLDPFLRSQVKELVTMRRAEAALRRAAFDAQMAALGITVVKKPGAVEPVNVQVKQPVKYLRHPPSQPSGPAEPYLAPESVEAIVKLLDQSGKGFETTPSAYNKLDEPELRDILLGHLNNVFGATVATGETFSKRGKTDIFLQVPGGAVLIGECQVWGGPAGYIKKLHQMFGYLTFRHTVGVLITISRIKGLTRIVDDAEAALKVDATFRSALIKKAPTYFVSKHDHPADSAKDVTVHHLFFDLAMS